MAEPRFLLDTNTLIFLAEQTDPEVMSRAEACAPGELITSTIVVAEFVRGFDLENPKAEQFLSLLFDRIPVMAFDLEAARRYAALPFRRNGFDRLIAAHALSLDLTLVTSDLRGFADVPGLKLEDWTR